MNFYSVFNVMCCVWTLVLQSLTLFALMIKLTSLKGWLCLQIGKMLGATVGMNTDSVYGPKNSLLRLAYSGQSIIKCISSSTWLTQTL